MSLSEWQLSKAAVFRCVCVCVYGQAGPARARVVSKWQQWWQLSSVQGWYLVQQWWHCTGGWLLGSWYLVGTSTTHLLQDSQLLKYGDVTDSDRKGRQVTNLSNSVKLVSKIQRTLWVVDWDYKNPVYSSIVNIINNITQTWSPTPKLDVKLPYKGGSSLNSSTSAARLVPKKMILLSGPSIHRMWQCFW